tara:strand:- start:456 stop:752 length:297 start_codon:yes stop_codon:yes gene_type:complete
MYKVGDIVIIKSMAGDAIPAVEAKLLKKIESKEGWVGWECELTKPEEADMLRKEWSIPLKFPDHIYTFAFESNILSKATSPKKRKRKRRVKKSKSRTT